MKKNLIYYFYLKNNKVLDKVTTIHLNALKHYSHLFDGEKIIYVATDNNIDNKDEVLNLFNFLGTCDIKFVKNDLELRESKYFIESINKIKDKNSLTFYGHSKGLTTEGNPDAMIDWITSMYFFNLDSMFLTEKYEKLMNTHVFSGTLRKHVSCPPCVSSDWHYSGTFFWFNTKKLFDKTLDFYKYGRFEVESFSGNHSDLSLSDCDKRFSYDYNFDARYSDFWNEFFGKLNESELLKYKKFKKTITTDELTKITNYIGSDKGDYIDEKHQYTEVYNNIFMLKRNKPINMLEIGIKDPRFPYASVKIWDLYFKNPNIIGLDINDSEELELLIPNFTYKHLDQYSVESHKNITEYFTNNNILFDYIIDDGPHYFDGQVKSLDYFFNFLKKGGYYIIEDLHVDDIIINYVIENNFKYKLYCEDKLMIISNE
jgi:hypothetical protein